MNDIHAFFADRVHQIATEVGTKEFIEEDELIGSIDQTMGAVKWMIKCLHSPKLEDEVSVIASEVLKEA